MAACRLIELATSPPALHSPVTEQEVRQFLRLPDLSPPDGLAAQIQAMIASATFVAEKYQGRDLIPRRYRLVVEPAAGSFRLRTPVAAVHSVSAIAEDLTETPLGASDYQFDGDNAQIRFLSAHSRAAIEYSTGAAQITDAVRAGILQLIALWWQARVPVIEANSQRGAVELPHSLAALLRLGGDPYGTAS